MSPRERTKTREEFVEALISDEVLAFAKDFASGQINLGRRIASTR
jgi:hypothetical protein